MKLHLRVGDILYIDGTVFGEIDAITTTGLVRYNDPGGEKEIGKAALRGKLSRADSFKVERNN